MGYLLTEIVVYLVIAGLIGFVFGWLVRDGKLDKYFDKVIELMKKLWVVILGFFGKIKSYFSNLEIFKKSSKTEETKESVTSIEKEVTEPVKAKESVAEVAIEKVAEVAKEEVKAEESIKEEPKAEAVAEITKEVEAEVVSTEETVEVMVDSTKPTLLTEAPTEGQDKLSSLKGLGPVMEKKLNELGVYTFTQMASWNEEQALWIGTELSSPNKVIKEAWVAQAQELLKNK